MQFLENDLETEKIHQKIEEKRLQNKLKILEMEQNLKKAKLQEQTVGPSKATTSVHNHDLPDNENSIDFIAERVNNIQNH